MGKYGDWIIMGIVGILAAVWIYGAFYRWLHAPAATNGVKLGKGGAIAEGDPIAALLKRQGYRVVSGKHVLRIPVELDDVPLGNGTRLYIDYVVENGDHTYIVKTARDRMPMDWTASGVRDRLLIYSLLLPDCSGILYVDGQEGRIRKIVFHIAD
ncbi:hypothetical protein [Paenibacillus sp. PL2-23]|uniref:hypothetical protein n=1 Tax=Paenibacillus sp. PL2-23 TaxID=2100729 RepID=UPI0030FCD520